MADFWLGRVDAAGNRLWSRTFGGTNDEHLIFGQQLPDQGFILAGTSYSGSSGNKTSTNFGGAFRKLGDILSVPELTVNADLTASSPFLNLKNANQNNKFWNVNDAVCERLGP